jgi:hypothetical protein
MLSGHKPTRRWPLNCFFSAVSSATLGWRDLPGSTPAVCRRPKPGRTPVDCVVIVGDFNETLGTNPKLMASVCAEHKLFDAHAHYHGSGANIPTYARGTKRLDYGIATTNLEQYIDACGFNLFNEHLHSDHRASFKDIRLKECFGHNPPHLANPDLGFMSTSSPDIIKFVQKMYTYLDENKAFHQYQDFCLDDDVVAAAWIPANHLDTMIGQAFQTAEKHCSKQPRPPWSEKLHHASLRVRYWKVVLTERHTRVSQATVLRRLVAEIWGGQNRANNTTQHPHTEKCLHGRPTGAAQSPSPRGERKGKVSPRIESTPGATDVVEINRRRRRHQDHRSSTHRRPTLPADCQGSQTKHACSPNEGGDCYHAISPPLPNWSSHRLQNCKTRRYPTRP